MDYSVSLNFLPLLENNFSFIVYRRLCANEMKSQMPESCSQKSLPNNNDDLNIRSKYWVSFKPIPSFDKFNCKHNYNTFVTLDYLYSLLLDNVGTKPYMLDFYEDKSFARKRISFVIQEHPEGKETIWFEPYLLKSQSKFGFLIDYKFRRNIDKPFSKRMQQLSLSLDKYGRENKSFYADRFAKIQEFIDQNSTIISPLNGQGNAINVDLKLLRLTAMMLDKKTYIFHNSMTHNSQYIGIKQFSPFENLADNPTIYFVYRKGERHLSVELYKALRGDSFPNIFPGMKKMFGIEFDGKTVVGIPITNFDETEMMEVRDKILSASSDKPKIALLIAPWKSDDEEDSEEYFRVKHIFISSKIPTQVVRAETLEKSSRLQWSASNIGLQCFAKLGGKPWKVHARHQRCLIIGIGQSHRVDWINQERKICRYYAYSVLTDSSGLFKELKVLGIADDEENYLHQLKSSIEQILAQYGKSYDHYVIHAPYKIRKVELDSIEEVLRGSDEGSKKQFVVLKVNSKSSFFGYSQKNNSLVPYESTYVNLASGEYVVWFEGLQYHNPQVLRRYSRPIHIIFHYSNIELSKSDMCDYLQDAVNLSGANWRGFNAKNLPVSIYYAQLVARFIGRFDEFGLRELSLENLHPWFL